ncbi:MAG: hypothetical protein AVDCRST_MAG89-3824, partial [uncultured Gemmatimonadetes bacterium]
ERDDPGSRGNRHAREAAGAPSARPGCRRARADARPGPRAAPVGRGRGGGHRRRPRSRVAGARHGRREHRRLGRPRVRGFHEDEPRGGGLAGQPQPGAGREERRGRARRHAFGPGRGAGPSHEPVPDEAPRRRGAEGQRPGVDHHPGQRVHGDVGEDGGRAAAEGRQDDHLRTRPQPHQLRLDRRRGAVRGPGHHRPVPPRADGGRGRPGEPDLPADRGD